MTLSSRRTAATDFQHAFSRADWAQAGLGGPGRWDPALSTLVELALATATPVFIAWGEELRLVYNEAYLEILGERHPRALGQPLAVIWPDIWLDIEPLIRRTLAGESLYLTDVDFVIERGGSRQRAWFSFSYTPVRDRDGRIAGVYCALTETTQKVLTDQDRIDALDRLRQLFDRAPGFVAVTAGPEHRVELVNEACLQLIGRTDVIGKPVRDAVPELGDQVYLGLFNQVHATGEPYVGERMEVYFQPPGMPRMLRHVDFVFQPIRAHDGRVSGVFVQGIDVTEQHRAEEQLRESELRALTLAAESESYARKLDALLTAAPVGILYADTSGRIEVANPAIENAWGALPEVATVEEYRMFKAWFADGSARHGEPLQPADWPLARALAGEEDVRAIVEVEPLDARGPRRTVKLQARPVRAHGGTIAGAVVAEMDVTEQVQAQERLRESEAKFRTITDAMPQIVWSTRPDGHHDYFNQRWYDFTGLPPGGTDGDAWVDVVHPDDRERALQAWRRSLETGAPYQIEYRFRHRSGEYRWVLGRALPVRDEAGRVVRWMGTSTDIHKQKRAQQHLQDASRRKDEFLAMLAHELRNPLAPISVSAHMLADVDDPARARELGAIIQRQAAHMTRMVDDLLDVSRVTRGLARLERELVDLVVVVRGACEQVAPLVRERGHALSIDVPAHATLVWGDRVRLTQVITNLLDNAAKYTRHGGRIEVALRADDDHARIRVTDTGSGIEPELLPFVFDLFTQGQRGPDRTQGGLGIGLALARGIAALHDGELTATSAGRGHGSCFELALPLAEVAPGDARGGREGGHGRVHGATDAAAHALEVMVVDDNVDAARTVAMLLGIDGHAVRVVHDADAALAEAARHPAAVYVLDIGLPGMSGYELARRLRASAHSSRARMIALTGYGRSEDRSLSREAGFDRHFVKPVDAPELLAALRELRAGIDDANC